MSIIDRDTSKAILEVMRETGRARPLGIRSLTTFVNPSLRVPADVTTISQHVIDLETRGYVERRASPLDPATIEYIITPAGEALYP